MMPRTPSPKVRIRSQSFDSPGSGGSRSSITPIEHYSPFSKSTGAIKALSSYEAIKAVAEKVMRPLGVMLLPLNTKMSDDEEESDVDSSSSRNTSPSSSPTTTSFPSANSSSSPVSTSSASRRSRRSQHPLAEAQSVSDGVTAAVEFDPTSPFLYQDTSFAMYSPWLVRVVLDMYDVRGLCWMNIADPIQRVWGVQTSSAEVLGILSDNGRVGVRRWWD